MPEPHRFAGVKRGHLGGLEQLRRLAYLFLPTSLVRWSRDQLKTFRNRKRLLANFSYDLERFLRHASPFRELVNRTQKRSYIMMLSHGVEKGLALPEPRPGFGYERVDDLKLQIDQYRAEWGIDETLRSALSALDAYVRFNQAHSIDSSALQNWLNLQCAATRKGDTRLSGAGGVRSIKCHEIQSYSKIDLRGFFDSRFSIRQFAPQPIANELIEEAVHMAQKTPSVCNRQSARVHVFENELDRQRLLECQQGNRGFGHQAARILVVTSDLGSFLSVGERNQCWIDGGMFAMSLIYALHSLGLGTCCLNWSVEQESDLRLRKVARISESENVIMLIAVGHLPDELEVAYSQRLPLDEVLTFHGRA